MAANAYTDLQAIEMKLRTVTNRIEIGDTDPAPGTNTTDITRQHVEQIRSSTESAIENRLSRFYVTPLAMTHTRTVGLLGEIATALVAYNVWATLHPAMSIDSLPVAVLSWKTDADKLLDQIVPMNKSRPEQGRDIILEGETLRSTSDDTSTANVEFTTKLSWGGSS